jgi:hypothetical protein
MGSAYTLLYRGHTRLRQGDLQRAAADYRRCIEAVVPDLAGWGHHAVRALVALAEIACQRGDLAYSGKLFGAAAALDPVSSAPSASVRFAEIYEFKRSLAAAERRRDPVFEAAWQEGEKLTLQEAVSLALEG